MPPDNEMRQLVRLVVQEAWKKAGGQAELLTSIAPLLGDVVPKSSSAVSNWASGKDRPTAETLLAIARVYDIRIDEYLYGESVRSEVDRMQEGWKRDMDQVRRELAQLREGVDVGVGPTSRGNPAPSG